MGENSQPEPKPEVNIDALSSGEVTVLPSESWDDLEQLEQELNEQFEPNTEQFLVDRMIHARWKLARVRRFESQAAGSQESKIQNKANPPGAWRPSEPAKFQNEPILDPLRLPTAGPVQNEPNFEASPPEDSAPRL